MMGFSLLHSACNMPFASDGQGASDKLVLVHYMPWYATAPFSGHWGWHWTMNRFDPDRVDASGRREIASHAYPLIGPYDSNDPYVLEYHVLLMKMAGVDGVIIDWYGTSGLRDYGTIHRNAAHLIEYVKKAGLQFAVCYEDRTVEYVAEERSADRAEAVAIAAEDIAWLERMWFGDAAYVRTGNRPILPVFGPIYFQSAEDWDRILANALTRPLLYALPHRVAATQADGVFGWPPVYGGREIAPSEWMQYLTDLYEGAVSERAVIGVAFPQFRDRYETSYGSIDARGGATFRQTLTMALDSACPIVQIATWNDFGEGTSVEPTVEDGYRYLESIQQVLEGRRGYMAADLRLPLQLYGLRQRAENDPTLQRSLDEVADGLSRGKVARAQQLMAEVQSRLRR